MAIELCFLVDHVSPQLNDWAAVCYFYVAGDGMLGKEGNALYEVRHHSLEGAELTDDVNLLAHGC